MRRPFRKLLVAGAVFSAAAFASLAVGAATTGTSGPVTLGGATAPSISCVADAAVALREDCTIQASASSGTLTLRTTLKSGAVSASNPLQQVCPTVAATGSAQSCDIVYPAAGTYHLELAYAGTAYSDSAVTSQALKVSAPASGPSGPSGGSTGAIVTSATPGAQCQVNGNGNNLGFTDPAITMSNGYNTYVGNDMWGANPGSTQTTCAVSPGDWTAVANDGPSSYTGVQAFPDAQQLLGTWDSTNDSWDGGPNPSEPLISALTSLTSTYATVNPSAGDFEAAYDIWLDNTSGAGEVMIWVYNVNRGTGGATVLGHTTLFGVPVTLMAYGGTGPGGELILSLDDNQASGTIDVLSALKYLQGQGLVSAGATIGQVNFGWEICNTAGQSEDFSVTKYALTAQAA